MILKTHLPSFLFPMPVILHMNKNTPVQVNPSPVYPGKQVQLWPPSKFVQLANSLQFPLFTAHSSMPAISETHTKKVLIYFLQNKKISVLPQINIYTMKTLITFKIVYRKIFANVKMPRFFSAKYEIRLKYTNRGFKLMDIQISGYSIAHTALLHC